MFRLNIGSDQNRALIVGEIHHRRRIFNSFLDLGNIPNAQGCAIWPLHERHGPYPRDPVERPADFQPNVRAVAAQLSGGHFRIGCGDELRGLRHGQTG